MPTSTPFSTTWPPPSRPRGPRPAPRGTRRAAKKRLAEVYAAERRFGRIEMDAIGRFVATVPQTLAGAAAALRYVREHFDEGCPLCEEEGYMTLLGSTERTICRFAGLPVPVFAQRWVLR